ncbi:MAG: ATP-binding protein [Pseudomonadota bacterium]
MTNVSKLIAQAETLLTRLEALIPQSAPVPDWKAATAFRWRKRENTGYLQAIPNPHRISLDDLRDVDEQKKVIERNTRQFVSGQPANNILLTGARGTGKSSLVKAMLAKFAKKGLRLIEVDKQDLVDLPDIVDLIAARPERFIIYCDDLSFEASESAYKALKVVLDGSIAGASENVLIYATSNRRHLMPEYMSENLQTRHVGDEIHPSEGVEEKISLSERFGIWLSFYPFNQEQYLDIVDHWVASLGVMPTDKKVLHNAALLWALTRGSRSGRVAWQFARDWAGSHAVKPAK